MMTISLVVDSQKKSTIAVFLTDALSVLQANKTVTSRKKLCNYSAITGECLFSGHPPTAEFLEMNKKVLM